MHNCYTLRSSPGCNVRWNSEKSTKHDPPGCRNTHGAKLCHHAKFSIA